MVLAMESGLYIVTGLDQKLGRAILAETTADPLARAWRSVMVGAGDLSEKEIGILKGLSTEITKLINLRNDWSHGGWFVGQGESADDWSTAWLLRLKNSASGVAVPASLESHPTAEYIEKAAAHANLVSAAISAYSIGVVRHRHRLDEIWRPSNRVRFVKVDKRSQLEVSENGSDWRSSEWVWT